MSFDSWIHVLELLLVFVIGAVTRSVVLATRKRGPRR